MIFIIQTHFHAREYNCWKRKAEILKYAIAEARAQKITKKQKYNETKQDIIF